ncbi:hypothetical protein PTNB73_04569 [Pyrenophora teres f. teres]|nr:hypothetical protein HRS9122_06768 [Pyrenophora teres f. teres]KAE8869516.1 hypothetical protein PTNB73_04569 [Pyrenophora teres f. teres]
MERKPSPDEIEAKLVEILSVAPLTLEHITDSLYPFGHGYEDAIVTVFEYMTERIHDGEEGVAKYGLKGYTYDKTPAKTPDSPDMEIEDESSEEFNASDDSPDVAIEEEGSEDDSVSEDSEELPGNEGMEGYNSPTLPPPTTPRSYISSDELPLLPSVGSDYPSTVDLGSLPTDSSTEPESSPTHAASSPTRSFIAKHGGSPSSPYIASSPPVITSSPPPPVKTPAPVRRGSESSDSSLSSPGSILDHPTPSLPPRPFQSPVPVLRGSESSDSFLSSPGTILNHPTPSLPPRPVKAPAPVRRGSESSDSSLSSPGSILNHPTPSSPAPVAGTKRPAPTNGGQPGPKRPRKTAEPRKQTTKVARAGNVVLQCTGTTRRGARCGFTKQMPQGTQTWDCGRHNR